MAKQLVKQCIEYAEDVEISDFNKALNQGLNQDPKEKD
jgi:hypothetical protein